jgi:putative colanic acid biosynthesis acetyltransferase WcaB
MRMVDFTKFTQDWHCNLGVRIRLLLLLFRISQWAQVSIKYSFLRGALLIVYRLYSLLFFHAELPAKLRVGTRLRIFHGYNIVVHEDSVLGDDVVLRQGVTIGNKGADGGCPKIGDRVELGANSVVVGDVLVGSDVVIGAGTVVVKSVPSGAVVVGSGSRVL